MVTSISSQLAALQAIGELARQLEITRLRVTTGLKVTGPADNPSSFSIAQSLRGDISGVTAVKTALATGESTVEAAIAAGESIEDLLSQIKATFVGGDRPSGWQGRGRAGADRPGNRARSQRTVILQQPWRCPPSPRKDR